MRLTDRLIWGLLVIASLLSVAAPAIGAEQTEIDFFKASGIKPKNLRSAISAAIKNRQRKSLPMILTLQNKHDEFLAKQSVVIRWNGGSERLNIPQGAIIRFDVTLKKLDGLKILAPAGFTRLKQRSFPTLAAYEAVNFVQHENKHYAVVQDSVMSTRLRRHLLTMKQDAKATSLATLQKQLRKRNAKVKLPEPTKNHWTPAEIFQQRKDAVVVVGSLHKSGQALHASGVIIDPDGLVLTNYHVANKSPNAFDAVVVMTREGKQLPILEVVAADRSSDIAVLRVKGKNLAWAPLSMGDPEGTPVVVISHPQSRYYCLTQGYVSRYAGWLNFGRPVAMMSITADFAGGSSGGPVFNPQGAVSGIVVATNPVKDQMVFKDCAPAQSVRKMLSSAPTASAESRSTKPRSADSRKEASPSVASRPISENASESKYFEKGILLQADGKVIQTTWFGHAAPALLDVDNDGDMDLLVGQYTGGDVVIYKNTGNDRKPVYSAAGKLTAGGEVAQVKTFCCIGFTPCIVDFDHDGHLDILTGCYPGQLYIYHGKGDGKFAKRKDLLGADGTTLRPGFASTAHAADLDGDGDYDLLSSLKSSRGMAVCYNEGTPKKPLFQKWEDLRFDGKKLSHSHTGPVVCDFDGDGIQDLLFAREKNIEKETWRSQLLWARNTATSGRPVYGKPKVMLDGHVGLRLKAWPVDYDHDGHLDLLIGDMFADCPQKEYTGFVWFYRRRPTPRASSDSLAEKAKEVKKVPNTETNTPPPGLSDTIAIEVSGKTDQQGDYLSITVSVKNHWYIQSETSDKLTRTRIELPTIPGVTFSKPEFPESTKRVVFGKSKAIHEGTFKIKVPYEIDRQRFSETRSGKERFSATLKFYYQMCGDASAGGVCFPPTSCEKNFLFPFSAI